MSELQTKEDFINSCLQEIKLLKEMQGKTEDICDIVSISETVKSYLFLLSELKGLLCHNFKTQVEMAPESEMFGKEESYNGIGHD